MYSEQFKKLVREVYGNQFDNMLKVGDYFLGRYLDDSSQGSIELNDILLATTLQEIQDKARILKRKKEVYKAWGEDPHTKQLSKY